MYHDYIKQNEVVKNTPTPPFSLVIKMSVIVFFQNLKRSSYKKKKSSSSSRFSNNTTILVLIERQFLVHITVLIFLFCMKIESNKKWNLNG